MMFFGALYGLTPYPAFTIFMDPKSYDISYCGTTSLNLKIFVVQAQFVSDSEILAVYSTYGSSDPEQFWFVK
jgi:hypothetical protein